MFSQPTRMFCAPLLLLIINGTMIALMLALAKTATQNGVSTIAYAFWQTLGGGLLLGMMTLRQYRFELKTSVIRYFLISGATGIAIPNATAFWVVGKIGPGFTASLYAFPPLFTLLFAAALKLEHASPTRLIGICLSGAGCLWLVWIQHDPNNSEHVYWYVVGLLVPLSLACGNVYRTFAWPASLPPLFLASGMLLTASLLLWLYHFTGDRSLFDGIQQPNNALILAGQAILTALTYLGFFELQRRSTPLFLSQTGSIAALAGLAISLCFFDTEYRHMLWAGIAAVLIGLWVTTRHTQFTSR